VTRRGPAVRHAPVTEPTAEVSGFGGRYTCSYRVTHVWDRGHEVPPEPDGSFWLAHPDLEAEGIWEHLTRRQIHERSFGRTVPGGCSITEDDRIVYDNRGRVLPRTTKPVGWSKHEMPAVSIGGELCLIDDLWQYAWGNRSTLIAPSREPFSHYNEETRSRT
jgi:hypothetical protein